MTDLNTPEQLTFNEMIEHILITYHDYAYEAFPRLCKLALDTIRFDGKAHPEVLKVHKSINTLRIGLEQHLITEEETFYPLIKAFGTDGDREALTEAVGMIERIEEEHVGADHIFTSLRKSTADYAVPADASKAMIDLYQGIQDLEESTREHINFENLVLHPKLRTS